MKLHPKSANLYQYEMMNLHIKPHPSVRISSVMACPRADARRVMMSGTTSTAAGGIRGPGTVSENNSCGRAAHLRIVSKGSKVDDVLRHWLCFLLLQIIEHYDNVSTPLSQGGRHVLDKISLNVGMEGSLKVILGSPGTGSLVSIRYMASASGFDHIALYTLPKRIKDRPTNMLSNSIRALGAAKSFLLYFTEITRLEPNFRAKRKDLPANSMGCRIMV